MDNLHILAAAASITIIAFGVLEIFSLFCKKEKLISDLEYEKIKIIELENAISDVVEAFGEDGITMHKNTYRKIIALSRAKTIVGKINPTHMVKNNE